MRYVKPSYTYITLYGMVTRYTCKTFDRLYYNIIFLIFLCQNSIILKINHIISHSDTLLCFIKHNRINL